MKLSLCALALGANMAAHAAAPVITSFSGNGVLVASNLVPGTVATVEWASSLSGPWTNTWAGLDAVTVDSNGMISVSVPMFYRVRGMAQVTNPAPAGMVLIPAGSFTMGNSIGDSDILDANPTDITVSAFYMDTNLMNYSQWQTVFSWATSHGYGFDFAGTGKAANHPVLTVAWFDVVKWCNARSQQAGLTPVYYTDAGLTQIYTNGDVTVYVNWATNGYRLPTEAEWEKAARGGLIGQRFPWGNTISESQANYFGNTSGYSYDLGPYNGYNTNFNKGGLPYTSPVGFFAPNGYGLYDMAGNVFEWCWDWYGTPYGQPTTTNPTGPAGPGTDTARVLRGGVWNSNANSARCAYRYVFNPFSTPNDFGFHCVRGL